jgi:DNA-binding transcriptional regulator YiaG
MTGTEVREIRESLGLTQEELARWLGLSGRSNVAHIEAGRKAVTGPIARLMQLLRDSDGKIFRPQT